MMILTLGTFPNAQRQLPLQSVVNSGGNSKCSEILCEAAGVVTTLQSVV